MLASDILTTDAIAQLIDIKALGFLRFLHTAILEG